MNTTTETWRPRIVIHALASRVLAVARTRIEGTWCAYIDAVPGEDHNAEYREVLYGGAKLPPEIARILFPQFADIPYAL